MATNIGLRHRFGTIIEQPSSPTSSFGNPEEPTRRYEPRVLNVTSGVWDIVFEKGSPAAGLLGIQFTKYSLHVRRFIGDLWDLNAGLLVSFLSIMLMLSFMPAVTLYTSARLLQVVQDAVDNRTFDGWLLLLTTCARVLCSIATRLLSYMAQNWLGQPLEGMVARFLDRRLLDACIRLDPVTMKDPMVQQELKKLSPDFSGGTNPWNAVIAFVTVATSVAKIMSQIGVLSGILYGSENGLHVLLLGLVGPALQVLTRPYGWRFRKSYYGTTGNLDYIRMTGLRQLARDQEAREDIVCCNAQEYIREKFEQLSAKLGGAAIDFHAARIMYLIRTTPFQLLLGFLEDTCEELPQVLFAVWATRTSTTVPFSLTWLALVHATVQEITREVFRFLERCETLESRLEMIKGVYECVNIPNQIADGSEAYPQLRTSSQGMSVELKNVGFRYPGSENFALRNVSFSINPGELCVIVGKNGSGKSSIIKLLCRLYDCQEGEILIDNLPVQGLIASDYRKCISNLPQRATYFPLTVAENIGIGDPLHAEDLDRIRASADSAGALGLIEGLPQAFDTNLKKPETIYCDAREPAWAVYAANKTGTARNPDLSEGEWQKLALSRAFMGTTETSKLLCYDEPSANLDARAERDLFERLQRLRGKKTMVLVTHRFGRLTTNAEKIICLDEGAVVEQGTHEELLALKGRASQWLEA